MDSLSEKYTERSEHGSSTPSSISSPFKGRTADQCATLLQQLRNDTESDIDYELFVIMDQRTLHDGTVTLANIEPEWRKSGELGEDEERHDTVRILPELADMQLTMYFIGDSDVHDDHMLALKHNDGVLNREAIECSCY